MISHKLLGTNEWFVIHHTDCGMELSDDQTMGELLAEDLAKATYTPAGWQNSSRNGGSPEGRYVRWLTFKSLESSVREDVARIRNHPLVPANIPAHGQIYDVRSGRLIDVHCSPVSGAGVLGSVTPPQGRQSSGWQRFH